MQLYGENIFFISLAVILVPAFILGYCENRMTFEQFTKRGVVKAVLPDLPPTKDLNKIAKTFGLPLPTGETLKNVKSLVKSRGLGVYIKFMQKAYAFTRQKKLPLTWEAFGETANTYLKLSYMKTEQY